jgi:tetratricopeptide (TPR) repeat protein
MGKATEKNKPMQANAAASLHTTALDFARFVVAIMDGTGLKPQSSVEMLRAQIRLDETCTNCTDRKAGQLSERLSWGLGWGLEKTQEGESFWHWGDNGVFRCLVMGSRAARSGFVMFTNSANGLSIAEEVAAVVTGAAHPALSWVHYDRYDSPATKLFFTVMEQGAAAGIRNYQTREKVPGAPALQEDQLNSLGYQLLRSKRADDAILIFRWNAELYPGSANVYDSLAEAYMSKGEKELAIRNYRKSLEINPGNDNARERLKELEKP